MRPLDEQIESVLEECQRMVSDFVYYHHITSSSYFHLIVEKKIQQLQGLLYAVRETSDARTMNEAAEQLKHLKLEVFAVNKKWKLSVQSDKSGHRTLVYTPSPWLVRPSREEPSSVSRSQV